jgi:hypothetical protein
MSFCAGFLLVANRHVESQEAPISSEFLDFYHRATMARSACARTRQGTAERRAGHAYMCPETGQVIADENQSVPPQSHRPILNSPNAWDDDASVSPVTRFEFHLKALAFKVG